MEMYEGWKRQASRSSNLLGTNIILAYNPNEL
jgi:hypothetical protein